LNDALDIKKSKTDAISVNILHKNKKDVTSLLVFGVIALCYGFGVYYLLPLSLVSFNFSLAMTIFLFILFGMIFALAILIINFMPYIHKVVSFVILIRQPKSIKLMVKKNLIAHKNRNQMTTLMFSLTLGFIIFLNIVAKIPFYKELNEVSKGVGYTTINLGRFN
jgi:uncharacterized protein YqhQ